MIIITKTKNLDKNLFFCSLNPYLCTRKPMREKEVYNFFTICKGVKALVCSQGHRADDKGNRQAVRLLVCTRAQWFQTPLRPSTAPI